MQIENVMRTATKRFSGHGGTHRPRGIIVHALGEFIELGDGDLDGWSYLEHEGLSAHALVYPSGTVVRGVADETVAFHARGFNTNWLGLEILVPGVHTYMTFLESIRTGWCTDAAWQAAVAQVQIWRGRWGIDIERIVRHSDVSPGRKLDPGPGFAWGAFREAVQS